MKDEFEESLAFTFTFENNKIIIHKEYISRLMHKKKKSHWRLQVRMMKTVILLSELMALAENETRRSEGQIH